MKTSTVTEVSDSSLKLSAKPIIVAAIDAQSSGIAWFNASLFLLMPMRDCVVEASRAGGWRNGFPSSSSLSFLHMRRIPLPHFLAE